MKNLICLMMVSLVMLFGCSKDLLTDENPDMKKAKVPVPFKGEMCMGYNYDVPLMPVEGTPIGPIPKLYLQGAAWIIGHSTHMGEFQPQSSMTGLSAYLDMESLQNGKIVLVAEYEATIVADNGDRIDLLSHIRIDSTDELNPVITGDWIITSGSGKFENAEGSGTLSGVVPCWGFDGTLEYPR